jgi:hypothetical protein
MIVVAVACTVSTCCYSADNCIIRSTPGSCILYNSPSLDINFEALRTRPIRQRETAAPAHICDIKNTLRECVRDNGGATTWGVFITQVSLLVLTMIVYSVTGPYNRYSIVDKNCPSNRDLCSSLAISSRCRSIILRSYIVRCSMHYDLSLWYYMAYLYSRWRWDSSRTARRRQAGAVKLKTTE